jgi:hypothetical protein
VVHAVVDARHGVVERQAGVAAQAEDVFHAIELQHVHHRIGAGVRKGHVSQKLVKNPFQYT